MNQLVLTLVRQLFIKCTLFTVDNIKTEMHMISCAQNHIGQENKTLK